MAATGEEKRKETTKTMEKEGLNLLGSPKFTVIENGRFRCVETGHELLEKDKESYSHSKRCRLGLIEYALSHKNPPLNLFKQDPNSRSKLICKLTGNTVNKSEEHIWKHINGKRFLHKLEEKEIERESRRSGSAPKEAKEMPFQEKGVKEEKNKKKKQKKKEKMKDKVEEEEKRDKVADEANDGDDDDGDDDAKGNPEEAEFWMPPIGERWDFDEGGDRWGSGSDSEGDGGNEDSIGDDIEDDNKEDSDAISTGKKRKSEDPIELSLKENSDTKKNKDKKKKKIKPSSQL